MRFEHRSEPVIGRRDFYKRLASHILAAACLLLVSLAIGTFGLQWADDRISRLDALMNSAMLLGGMGPTADMCTDAAKWFSTFYSLYAGLVFVATSGWILAPTLHRILHKLHVDERDKLDAPRSSDH